jgi:hypothetical protein
MRKRDVPSVQLRCETRARCERRRGMPGRDDGCTNDEENEENESGEDDPDGRKWSTLHLLSKETLPNKMSIWVLAKVQTP